MPCRILILCLLLHALPCLGVLVESGDGTGNTRAPSPDPGWRNLGLRLDANGGPAHAMSAVYLGDSYVLTASHVGVGPVSFGGESFSPVPGTEVRLLNEDGSPSDLLLFSVTPTPALPDLAICAIPPALDDEVVVAGNGRDRGDPILFDPNGPEPPAPIGGFLWLSTRSLRWGTDQIAEFATLSLDTATTEIFSTRFEPGASEHEASASHGDSGGAVFWDGGSRGAEWELAGILIAITQYEDQDPNSSVYGNLTHAADLSYYRDDILAAVAAPEPRGGLPYAIAALGALRAPARRRKAGNAPTE